MGLYEHKLKLGRARGTACEISERSSIARGRDHLSGCTARSIEDRVHFLPVKQQTRVLGSVHGKLTAGLTHGWSVDGWRTRSGVVVRGHCDGPATRSVRHSASSARAVRKMMSLPERSDSTGCVTRTIMRKVRAQAHWVICRSATL